MANYDQNFHLVETFFDDIATGKLTGDAIPKRGYDFFGLVGPWYTVGWKMAVTIEQAFGRKAVVDAFCDQRTLMPVYNAAVKKSRANLPLWDERLVAIFGAAPASTDGSSAPTR